MSSAQPRTQSITVVLNVASAEGKGGTELTSADLAEYLQQEAPETVRLAVVLCRRRDTFSGVVLESVKMSKPERTCWMSVGCWDTRDVQDFPASEVLDIEVL